MGQLFIKTPPGSPLAGPNAKQGKFSSTRQLNTRQLNTTALKTNIVRPDSKIKTNSIDEPRNLKGAPKNEYLGKLL